ncbi:malate dehydrogenase [Chlamydiifrater phoenicopteri]|uniref:malate dehydrogenase n=1 Tax=Chlamydiifrater phoenicopteri TaxID=2681469 RepID=UPI001BD08DA0|nr:malate dehydrogenase [Chlamydiifrater phoenicopteri]
MAGGSLVKVAVTGGTGQIAYSFLFSLVNGDVFGKDQEIDLRVYDVPGTEKVLSGVRMELDDGAYPLMRSLRVCTDLEDAFDGIDAAFLIGAAPRNASMERSDLLKINGGIFALQGSVLNACANKNAKIFVVGNPANTNCLIAMRNAPSLKRRNFHAMLRLDQNRMHAMLSHRAGVPIRDVERVIVWGNHSAKQVPDFTLATIKGRAAAEYIGDRDWLENVMIPSVQRRGTAVIEARGRSSAASAARALTNAAAEIFLPVEGRWFSSGVCSDHNPYGIEEDLIFGFPCRMKADGEYEIVAGLQIDQFIQAKLRVVQEELLEEKASIASL